MQHTVDESIQPLFLRSDGLLYLWKELGSVSQSHTWEIELFTVDILLHAHVCLKWNNRPFTSLRRRNLSGLLERL